MKTEKNDRELIFQIIEISKKIFKIYSNLIKLEQNKLKESQEYQKNLKYLEILKEIENELYKKINLDKLNYYLNYVDPNLFGTISNFDLLITDFMDLYPNRRVYNRLSNIQINWLIKDLQENKIDENNEDQDIMLSVAIEEDFNKLFLYFLNWFINNDIYKIYQNDLIRRKYLMQYLISNLEDDFLSKKTMNKLYLLNETTADLFNLDHLDATLLKVNYYKKRIKKYIIKLLELEDQDYQNYNQVLNSLLYQALTKSIFEILNPKIHDIIKNESDNKISKSILEEIIQKRKMDTSIISLRSERISL